MFHLSLILSLFVVTLVLAEERSRPPLMPERMVDSHAEVQSSVSARKPIPTRLGIQGGGMAFAQGAGSPVSAGELFAGARLFSRLAMGERWYFTPSIGYYRLISAPTLTTVNPNLLELGAGFHYAFFKLGPLGFLGGVSQRLGWRFTGETGQLKGRWYYRVGPAATVNLRVTGSLSALVGAEVNFPLVNPITPEWVGHAGFLFAL